MGSQPPHPIVKGVRGMVLGCVHELECIRAFNAREVSWHWAKCCWPKRFRKILCRLVETCKIVSPFRGTVSLCLYRISSYDSSSFLSSRVLFPLVLSSLIQPSLVMLCLLLSYLISYCLRCRCLCRFRCRYRCLVLSLIHI